MSPEIIITRTLTYEYRFLADQAPECIELRDMAVIDDSGLHIEVGVLA